MSTNLSKHQNIKTLSDEEIKEIRDNLAKKIRKNKKDGKPIKDLEIEMCYVDREIEIRSFFKFKNGS